MPRSTNDRAAKARARMAETIDRASHRVRAGEALTGEARTELADLLAHVASDAVRDGIETHTWDQLMRLGEAIERPHLVHREGVGKLPSGWARGEPPRAL